MTSTLTISGPNGSSGVSQAFTAIIDPARIAGFLLGDPGAQIKGVSFPLTVTALNQFGDPYNGFSGVVQLSVSRGSINPSSISSFVNGVWSGAVTINSIVNSGLCRITAKYINAQNKVFLGSVELIVSHSDGYLDHFGVFVPTTVVLGYPFKSSISTYDQYNERFYDYDGQVTLSVAGYSVTPQTVSLTRGRWSGLLTVS